MGTTTAKPNRKLLPPQIGLAEHQRQELIVKPEPGTAIEEMQRPEYWAHVARQLRMHDRIEVRPADGTWWAELLVLVVEPFAVRVHVLRHEHFGVAATMDEIEVAAGYTVKHRGWEKWCVTRNSDSSLLHKRAESREAAVVWLRGHLDRLGETKQAA